MSRWLTAVAALGALLLTAGKTTGSIEPPSRGGPDDPPHAASNRNLRPAGRLHNGVLTLRLELVSAGWWPSADTGRSLPVHAFAEAGHAPEIPGPLIRVPLGTEVRATLHNTLTDSTLWIFGLHSRHGASGDSLEVRPGATRAVSFKADAIGTYYYWGTTTHRGIESREWLDSQLAGGFIVDPPGPTPRDRIFVLGLWDRTDSVAHPENPFEEHMTINGKGWPYSEELATTVGDSMVWRWINPTSSSHPMHLHGVFFRLASRGDWTRDTLFDAQRQPLEVTELMLPGATMTMRWAAARPGNWLFHCHFAFHTSRSQNVDPPPSGDHQTHDARQGMGGLVLGIHARGRGASPVPAAEERRQLRLVVQSAPRRFGADPGMGYVLQNGSEPAPDSIQIPGTPIVLTRGEPVRITVVNHLSEPTAVHWHGLEIESYPDGVPGWSGTRDHRFSAIAPGDSFAADFTPPRAGTFIYHSHAGETRQLGLGLYGPLIVLERGQSFEPETDRIVVVGLAGSSEANTADTASGLVNGRVSPQPMELKTGIRYRFRLINIDPDHRIFFRLVRDSLPFTWRPIAKDGAELPPALAVSQRAQLLTGPGETADFEVRPETAGELRLEISAPYAERAWTVEMPVHISER